VTVYHLAELRLDGKQLRFGGAEVDLERDSVSEPTLSYPVESSCSFEFHTVIPAEDAKAFQRLFFKPKESARILHARRRFAHGVDGPWICPHCARFGGSRFFLSRYGLRAHARDVHGRRA
jgi:hypothetical protein